MLCQVEGLGMLRLRGSSSLAASGLALILTGGLTGCGTAPAAPGSAGGTAVFGKAYTTGFFGGVHAFPYSNRLQPGRIYATTGKASGPVFGMEVVEICWNDTEAMREKFPDEMKTRTYEGEAKVEKTVGANGDFAIDGIKLPFLEVGAGGNYLNSAKYTFTKVSEIEVQTGTAEFVKANIKDGCRAVIANQRKQGRYVFVATKVYQPETSKVTFDFKAGVNGTLKANIANGIAPGIKGSGGQSRGEEREATNKVVEAKVVDF